MLLMLMMLMMAIQEEEGVLFYKGEGAGLTQ